MASPFVAIKPQNPDFAIEGEELFVRQCGDLTTGRGSSLGTAGGPAPTDADAKLPFSCLQRPAVPFNVWAPAVAHLELVQLVHFNDASREL